VRFNFSLARVHAGVLLVALSCFARSLATIESPISTWVPHDIRRAIKIGRKRVPHAIHLAYS
jgi:hypothetical protein